jgi:hypothetical protein
LTKLDYAHIGNRVNLHYDNSVRFEESDGLLYQSQTLEQFQDQFKDTYIETPLSRVHDVWFNFKKAIVALNSLFTEHPLSKLHYFLPFFILDHCPANYMRNFPVDHTNLHITKREIRSRIGSVNDIPMLPKRYGKHDIASSEAEIMAKVKQHLDNRPINTGGSRSEANVAI